MKNQTYENALYENYGTIRDVKIDASNFLAMYLNVISYHLFKITYTGCVSGICPPPPLNLHIPPKMTQMTLNITVNNHIRPGLQFIMEFWSAR